MAKATKDKEKDDVTKVEVVNTLPEGAEEHETQAEAAEERGPRYNDREYQDEEMSANPLGFTIHNGVLSRRGASRSASPEEIALWNALKDEDSEAAEEASLGQPLDDVDFASPEAESLAEDEDLGAEAFEGYQPSGEGGFTVADVRKIAGETQSDSRHPETETDVDED